MSKKFKFRFDHTARWYMHKPKSVLENDMHKLLSDFEIQKDRLILARKPDLVIVNKKKKKEKKKREPAKENEKRDKYLDLAREVNWCT